MAMSYTETVKSVVGDKKMSIYSVVMTGVTSGSFKTGYGNLHFAKANNESAPAATNAVKKNIASDGSTAEYGTVYFSGFTSGDTFTLQILAD